jgi:hypothetical protein
LRALVTVNSYPFQTVKAAVVRCTRPAATNDCIDHVDRALTPLGWFYKHNAMHAGTTPMVLDEFGRCARCVKLGFWKPDA